MALVDILAWAPLIMIVAVIYLMACWVFPIAIESTGMSLVLHLIFGFLIWLGWGIFHLV